jgi:hypothetical protein
MFWPPTLTRSYKVLVHETVRDRRAACSIRTSDEQETRLPGPCSTDNDLSGIQQRPVTPDANEGVMIYIPLNAI